MSVIFQIFGNSAKTERFKKLFFRKCYISTFWDRNSLLISQLINIYYINAELALERKTSSKLCSYEPSLKKIVI